jgi:hypothetical protein
MFVNLAELKLVLFLVVVQFALSSSNERLLRSEEPVPSEVEGIWASRVTFRALLETLNARLARFLSQTAPLPYFWLRLSHAAFNALSGWSTHLLR